MFRLYLTRLVLPVVFVAAMVALPFVWLPEPEAPPARGDAPAAGETRRAGAFQKTMVIGFALILVSVTAGGVMLYRITRAQSANWRRRFAPRSKNR